MTDRRDLGAAGGSETASGIARASGSSSGLAGARAAGWPSMSLHAVPVLCREEAGYARVSANARACTIELYHHRFRAGVDSVNRIASSPSPGVLALEVGSWTGMGSAKLSWRLGVAGGCEMSCRSCRSGSECGTENRRGSCSCCKSRIWPCLVQAGSSSATGPCLEFPGEGSGIWIGSRRIQYMKNSSILIPSPNGPLLGVLVASASACWPGILSCPRSGHPCQYW